VQRSRLVLFFLVAIALAGCAKTQQPTVTADCVVGAAPSTAAPVKKIPFPSTVRFDPGCASGDDACAAWREFRDDHPYPVQTFAGKRLGAGKAILILSEPPPDIDRPTARNAVMGAFQNLNPVAGIKRWKIGPDGYVDDIVLTFDAPELQSDDLLQSPDIRDRIAQLQAAWFGTACGGDVEIVGDGSARVAGTAPNLEVSAKDIGDWLSDPKLQWLPIEDYADKSESWTDLASDKANGAFLSNDGQLVLLTFDRAVLDGGDKLETLRSAFRRFAASTDAIIGAFWTKDGGDQVAFLGRRRTHPQSQIAPLRFETFKMLVAEGQDNLAQSYERGNALAGRIESQARDWAPIYLSPSLKDTEFGALLNVTDQMLKGWSQHGEVNYLTFAYPRTPSKFPFDKALSDIVYSRTKSLETLFNWNTKGAAVAVDRGDLTVFVVRKTGSLPIDYGASEAGRVGDPKTGGMHDLEDQAYTYFSDLQDPNLARVVQYTLIYQAVRNLREQTGGSAGSAPAPDLKPEMRFLVTEVRKLWPGIVAKNGKFAFELAQFKSSYPDLGDDAIALLMADRNDGPEILRSQGKEVPQEALGDANILAASFRADLGQDFDLGAIRDQFVRASSADGPGWIRTQSHIISWTSAPSKEVTIDGVQYRMVSVGGHNLDAVVDRFVDGPMTEAPGAAGTPIVFASEDADKFAAHAAEYSRELRHGNADEARLRAILDEPIPRRARWQALGYDSDKPEPSIARLGGRSFSSNEQFATALRGLKERTQCCRILARDEQGNAFIAETSPVPPPAIRVTGFGDTVSMGSYLRRFNGKPADVIALDHSQATIDALLSGVSAEPGNSMWLSTMVERSRNIVRRFSGRSDHIITSDLDGQLGDLAIERSIGSNEQRIQRIADLAGQNVRVATIEEVPQSDIARIVESGGWDFSREALPVGIRVRFEPGSSGGYGVLDVIARFKRPGDARILRQTITDVVGPGGKTCSFVSAAISIRRALEKTGHLSQILFVLRRGTAATQFASTYRAFGGA